MVVVVVVVVVVGVVEVVDVAEVEVAGFFEFAPRSNPPLRSSRSMIRRSSWRSPDRTHFPSSEFSSSENLT